MTTKTIADLWLEIPSEIDYYCTKEEALNYRMLMAEPVKMKLYFCKKPLYLFYAYSFGEGKLWSPYKTCIGSELQCLKDLSIWIKRAREDGRII